jgi:hypothetical protein
VTVGNETCRAQKHDDGTVVATRRSRGDAEGECRGLGGTFLAGLREDGTRFEISESIVYVRTYWEYIITRRGMGFNSGDRAVFRDRFDTPVVMQM